MLNAKQLFEIELNNDNLDSLLDIMENGHPSISPGHPCYDALEQLDSFTGCELINLFNEVN